MPGAASSATIQLSLGVGLRDGRRLDNFVAGANGEALAALDAMWGGDGARRVFLCGDAGTGKSHLLEAMCEEAVRRGEPAAYVPLAEAGSLDPGMVAGLEACALVCVDDVERGVPDRAWETALFRLHEAIDAAGGRLLLASRTAPAAIATVLPDLGSRLALAVLYRLRALDDADRAAALQRRARERGFDLPDDVVAWLLRHERRDMHHLMGVLDRLDRDSLAAQRRLTVPFVRASLGDGG